MEWDSASLPHELKLPSMYVLVCRTEERHDTSKDFRQLTHLFSPRHLGMGGIIYSNHASAKLRIKKERTIDMAACICTKGRAPN